MDIKAAYTSYLDRVNEQYPQKSVGDFVKFGQTMVQKLDQKGFEDRLNTFMELRLRCKQMLDSGSTISDVVMLEFEEATAWLFLRAPNLLELFSGEIGTLVPALE